MRDVIVIGAGHIGATIARMLAATGDYAVTLADHDRERLGASALTGVAPLPLDVNDPAALRAAITGKFAVLSAAPYHLTVKVAQAAKAVGAHYLDLTEDVAS